MQPLGGEEKTKMKEIKAIAKVFGKRQEYRFRVEADGSVLVFDSVAGHYTRCHSLSADAQRRIARKAVA
jgi:hypothetical protein